MKGPPVCARLVVPSSQVGCLLGKGGAIVSEMRKATGAAIRIFAGEHVPRCTLESDEVVQVCIFETYHLIKNFLNNLF